MGASSNTRVHHLNQGEDEGVADGLGDNSSRFPKVGFHIYVNKEISFVRSNDIMMYAQGKHTHLNIG